MPSSASVAVEGLEALLTTAGQPGLPELRELLPRVLGRYGDHARLLAEQQLRSRVHRLRFEVDGRPRSLVVKRFTPDRALCERAAITRWLPAVNLDAHAPDLLGTTAERAGDWVWHAYEDLGDVSLARGDFDPTRVDAAVGLLASLHVRFAGHRVLGEARLLGGDLGAAFFGASVRDAASALRALRPPAVRLSADELALRDRLLRRLDVLEREQHIRAATLCETGGVETLLHGDPGTDNIMILPGGDSRQQLRIIDWDHAGVGPSVYDLSTFLVHFDPARRPWVLATYRAAVGREAGWRLPDRERLNDLFETCEYARLANALLWPAIAASDPSPAWAFEDLAKIEQWFERLQPVLP